MIAYLCGTVIDKSDNKNLVINVNNVGYLLSVPIGLYSDANIDDEISMHVYTNVREDAITLFGFSTKSDLNFFRKLISVSGVGPRTALGFFTFPLDMITSAIVKKDISILTKIPGLGKKTAEKVAIELHDKVDISDISLVSHGSEAIDALEGLGFGQNEINEIMRSADSNMSTEDIVKLALSQPNK